ncbi:MAG: sensor histidine kinase N-terminal domain-containing protein, partial [Burkholderiales bacterium]|nr:sensor histidine kinase N-terminal domain-containing protein [Burkholderiales bacterium]
MSDAAPWSLRRRLLAMLGVATLVAWSASSLWLYRAAIVEADRLSDSALDNTAHAVLAVVRNEASELTESKEGVGFELAVIGQDRHNDIVYQVRGPNGLMVFRSHGAPIAPLAGPHERGFGYADVGGERYRVYSLAIELDAAVIHVGERISRRRALAHASALRLLAPGAALMLALALAVAWSVRRTTEPVVRYARSLDALAPDAEAGVDGSALPLELQPVARAIDGLLERVRDSLLRERTLTADAAHELRTPLAALRLQAQVARRSRSPRELAAALDELLSGTDRAARMVDSVLALARLDGRTAAAMATREVALGELARLVGAEFQPLARQRGIALTVAGAEVPVCGDEEALAIALRNLLANALRHARARIEVQVSGGDGTAQLLVRDDGPGFSAASARRAFHRFYRGNEADRPAHDGAGLGLALVLRVVQLHRGSVAIVDGIEGGAGVAMTLPGSGGSGGIGGGNGG